MPGPGWGDFLTPAQPQDEKQLLGKASFGKSSSPKALLDCALKKFFKVDEGKKKKKTILVKMKTVQGISSACMRTIIRHLCDVSLLGQQ